jgi:hypothetical protein
VLAVAITPGERSADAVLVGGSQWCVSTSAHSVGCSAHLGLKRNELPPEPATPEMARLDQSVGYDRGSSGYVRG